MTSRPSVGSAIVIQGKFSFRAERDGSAAITDTYNLQIVLPESFPRDLPVVTELDFRIPRNGDHHINSDGSLCLGSPLRLLLELSKAPSLTGFSTRCLVPYLYAISHKLKLGGRLPLGELEHGRPGEVQDYCELFSLQRAGQVKQAMRLLGMKKRLANKQKCPCGCGNRLGRCQFNRKIRRLRKLATRRWFLSHQL